ncbi:MAG TPA: hypothetical protein VIG08_01250 [Gemmatimonadales bacterium]|jgi:hypothetical protein
MKLKRPGSVRGILLQVGAVTLLAGITVVCLPLVWAKMAVTEEQPAPITEETDSLD